MSDKITQPTMRLAEIPISELAMHNPALTMSDKFFLKMLEDNVFNRKETVHFNLGSSDITQLANLLSLQLQNTQKQSFVRHDQITKAQCQAIARLKWKENPNFTIAELSQHPDIFNFDITGGHLYAERTIYDWLAEIDPRAAINKRGRPPKNLKNK